MTQDQLEAAVLQLPASERARPAWARTSSSTYRELSRGSRRTLESVLAWERECGESSSAVSHSAFSIAQPVRTSVSSR